LRSRMREMFNLISFPNDTPDKRKWTLFFNQNLKSWKSKTSSNSH
jgi:hypothetical protein